MKKLTIGSAVYDDFDGVYFSYQSIRLNNQDIWDDLDLLIIDNNPESEQGKATKEFCKKTHNIRYIPYTEKKSTAVRNEIFNNAQGKFCMSIDCHVLFEPDTIKKLIAYFEENSETKDLFHGPMFYDIINGHDPCTHMKPEWRSQMFGTWGTDKRGVKPDNPPFEIPMHGLGIFACKTNEWLGFNENFIGFGGEEGYIHKKYQKAGRKTWCLPFLRWLHRFQRPAGVSYPLKGEDRVRNYLIGHKELGLPFDEIIDHFKPVYRSINWKQIIHEVESQYVCENQMKYWENSSVDFKNPSKVRYLKYKVISSKDGHSCLRNIDVYPRPENIKVHSCSSQLNESSSKLLTKDGEWLSDPKDEYAFPHEFILDFGEICEIEKVTTKSYATFKKGSITKMKIYAGTNLNDFEEISEIDVNED